jgi:hypothetical protein
LLVVFCGLALIADRAVRFARTELSAAQIAYAVGGRRYEQMQGLALRSLHAHIDIKRDSDCDMYLIGLSADEVTKPVTSCVNRPLLVEKLAADWFADLSAGRYFLIITGTSSTEASATTCSGSLRLTELQNDGRRWIVSRSMAYPTFHPVDRPFTGPLTVARLSASPVASGSYVWSTASPPPSYEVDLYQGGLWTSTIAMWPGVIPKESIQMHLWEPNRSERTVMADDVAVVHL